MSRSTENKINNPATKFIEWSGLHGHFRYYDKEQQTNIELPAEFTFVVLDQLATVSGYCQSEGAGIYSNEVRNTVEQDMNVKCFSGSNIANGKWQAIKDTVKSHGGKYAKSVYAMLNGELVNLKLSGAALGPWIDFTKKFAIYEGAVKFTGSEQQKNGAITFYVPVFAPGALSKEDNEKAKDMDRSLQVYLNQYLAPKVENVSLNELTPETPVNMEPVNVEPAETDLPF